MQFEAREFAMVITRQELLETSIAQLQLLAAFLSDQLSETADGSAGLETRACKEILGAVSRLIQTHQSAARHLGGHSGEERRERDTRRSAG